MGRKIKEVVRDVVDAVTGEITRTRLNKRGHEILDDTPVNIPARFKRTESIAEQVQRIVETTLSQRAEAQGFETWEEANDFDVEDDEDPISPHEIDEETDYNYARDRDEYYANKRRLEAEARAASERAGEGQQGVQRGGKEKDANPEGPQRGEQQSGGAS